jgi:hypothetical protein
VSETVRKGSERPAAYPYRPFAGHFVLRNPAKSTLKALLEPLFGQFLTLSNSGGTCVKLTQKESTNTMFPGSGEASLRTVAEAAGRQPLSLLPQAITNNKEGPG